MSISERKPDVALPQQPKPPHRGRAAVPWLIVLAVPASWIAFGVWVALSPGWSGDLSE